MLYFYLAFSFGLGLIVGSFLNVVVLRYNTGHSILGSSGCLSCSHKLNWTNLFPLFSFLYLKGRCAYCKSKISIQYPLVEFFTGLLFLLTFLILKKFGVELIFYWIIWSLLVAIFVYDIRHKIIPDGLVLTFIILSLARTFLYPSPSLKADFITGILLFSLFALLWLVSKGAWMGFGDAKLVLGIGFLLGSDGSPSAIILSFWIGAIVSLALLYFGNLYSKKPSSGLPKILKNLTIKSEIPFAPFLIIGTMSVFFLKLDVFDLVTRLLG